jgi:hypothetical protein
MKNALYVIAALLGLFVLVAVMKPDTPEARDLRVHRAAIEQCWKDQARKSLAPAEARFIAGACEKMEADFKARFHVTP